jgi:hypothetical protein
MGTNMPSCTSRKRNKISWLLETDTHPGWYFLIYNTYIQIFQFNTETNKKSCYSSCLVVNVRLRIIFQLHKKKKILTFFVVAEHEADISLRICTSRKELLVPNVISTTCFMTEGLRTTSEKKCEGLFPCAWQIFLYEREFTTYCELCRSGKYF